MKKRSHQDSRQHDNNSSKKLKVTTPRIHPLLFSKEMRYSTVRPSARLETIHACSSCWLHIFSFLDTNDSLVLGRTCKALTLLHFIPQFENKFIEMCSRFYPDKIEYYEKNKKTRSRQIRSGNRYAILRTLHAIIGYQQFIRDNHILSRGKMLIGNIKQQLVKAGLPVPSLFDKYGTKLFSHAHYSYCTSHGIGYEEEKYVGLVHFRSGEDNDTSNNFTLTYHMCKDDGLLVEYLPDSSSEFAAVRHIIEEQYELPTECGKYDNSTCFTIVNKYNFITGEKSDKEEVEDEDEDSFSNNSFKSVSVRGGVLKQVRSKLMGLFSNTNDTINSSNSDDMIDDKTLILLLLYALPLELDTVKSMIGTTSDIYQKIEITPPRYNSDSDSDNYNKEVNTDENMKPISSSFPHLAKDVLKYVMNFCENMRDIYSLAKTCHHAYASYASHHTYCITYFDKQLKHHLSHIDEYGINDWSFLQLVKQSIKKLRFNCYMGRPLSAGPLQFSLFSDNSVNGSDNESESDSDNDESESDDDDTDEGTDDNNSDENTNVANHQITFPVIFTKIKRIYTDSMGEYRAECHFLGTRLSLVHEALDHGGEFYRKCIWSISTRFATRKNEDSLLTTQEEREVMSSDDGVLIVKREELDRIRQILLKSITATNYHNDIQKLLSDKALTYEILSLLPWPEEYECCNSFEDMDFE